MVCVTGLLKVSLLCLEVELFKFGEALTDKADGNTERSLRNKERVETERKDRKVRYSPDHQTRKG